MNCPRCGERQPPDQVACPRCATPLPPLGGGRYRIERVLGVGGHKRVYLARDGKLDRPVAIAVVERDADPAEAARIVAEARAMAKLAAHPNVVTVYDVGEDDGRPFIVSEYLSGGDLRTLLAASPGHRLPVRRALEVTAMIVRALEHLHARGVVHRDLSPANVWLAADGVAKLGDFGLAHDAGAGEPSGAAVAGTAAYVAPEQALGAPPDARSDLYALGVMLYEMLTGRRPFEGSDAAELIAAHVNTRPTPPSAHEPQLPPALDALVVALLAKRPDDRPPTATAVRQALEAVLPASEAQAGDATATWTPDLLRPAPPGRSRRIVLAVLVAAAAAALLVLLLRERAPAPSNPPLIVGVMSFAVKGPEPGSVWTTQVLRDGLNAVLSRVAAVRVYAKEVIDFKRDKQRMTEIEVAHDLGITKMVSGTVTVSGATTSVELRVVDIATGFLDVSIARTRPTDQLLALQNEVADALLGALGVALSSGERERLFARRAETMDDYRRFYETLGDVETPPPPLAPVLEPRSWRVVLGGVAYAAEPSSDEAAIRAVLEAYRAALEAEDLDALTGLHLRMSDRHREGLAHYFSTVRDLRVRFSAIEIAIAGDEALVSYTREDELTDERSGRPVRLDTRLSRLFTKRNGVWKIGDRKDPS